MHTEVIQNEQHSISPKEITQEEDSQMNASFDSSDSESYDNVESSQ